MAAAGREAEKRIAELKDDISCYTGRRKEYRIASDYFRSRAAKYKVLGQIPQSENAFFMEGWVPAGKVEQISKILSERFGALVEKEEMREGEEEPTLLRNNPFSAAAEGVPSAGAFSELPMILKQMAAAKGFHVYSR